MKPKSMHPRARLSSFGYAIRGIGQLFLQEPNAKIHALLTVLAVGLGFVRHISKAEWGALIVVIALVWMAEALNTAVEMLCDLWCKGEYHPQIKIIKDISAGAVLVAAIAAAATGLVIFLL